MLAHRAHIDVCHFCRLLTRLERALPDSCAALRVELFNAAALARCHSHGPKVPLPLEFLHRLALAHLLLLRLGQEVPGLLATEWDCSFELMLARFRSG